MPQVPMPTGLTEIEGLPKSRRSLTNCFNNKKGHVVTRPGIIELNTTGKVARGQFVWRNNIYQVANESLLKITDVTTGAYSDIGVIAGSEVIDVAVGFNDAVIVVKGGAIYTLNGSDVLTDISGNANFVPCVAVAHIDGRFIFIPADGDPAFFSDVGIAGSVQPLSFFDAEELPDKNSTVFNFKNTLFIGGTDSFELFRNNGKSPNPFGRISGARISNGFIGGLIEYNETFLFIGREKDQGFGVYAIGQGIAPKISNEAIDVVLRGYTQIELMAAVGSRFKWNGYDIAVFTLGRHSFGFYAGEWFILSTFHGSSPGVWKGKFINQLDGVYYVADGDKIGKLAKVNHDYDEKIIRVIDTAFEEKEDEWFVCQSLKLGISQGFNTDEPKTVGLSLTRDNMTYGNPVFRSLGALGEYHNKLEWNYAGGLGKYNGFMGLRIHTTQDVTFSSDKLIAVFR